MTLCDPEGRKEISDPKEISLVGGCHISLQISFIVITRKHFSTMYNWGKIKWCLLKKKKPSQYIPLCFVLNCLFFPHVISLFFVFYI